jgi:hypothetical protein
VDNSKVDLTGRSDEDVEKVQIPWDTDQRIDLVNLAMNLMATKMENFLP